MKTQVKAAAVVAPTVFGAARIALGIFWLHEGIFI
jgi:hypothetical protein